MSIRRIIAASAGLAALFTVHAASADEVNLYSSRQEHLIRPLLDAFTKFTGTTVNVVTAGEDALIERAKTEGANSPADVLITVDAGRLIKADQAGLFQPIKSPVLDAAIPAALRDPKGNWFGLSMRARVIFYSKERVKPEELSTYEALADPKWKGKLVWAESSGTGAPRVITHVRKLWGEDKAMAYLNRLKDQGVRTLPGSVRTVLDQIIAGEYPVGISMSMHHIADSMVKGAPIHGSSPDPALARAQSLHYVRGAPHPHAGMIFFEYFLSKDGGQQALREAKYNPAHPGVEPLPELRWFQPNLNGMKELIMPPEEVEAMRKSSSDIYKTLFR